MKLFFKFILLNILILNIIIGSIESRTHTKTHLRNSRKSHKSHKNLKTHKLLKSKQGIILSEPFPPSYAEIPIIQTTGPIYSQISVRPQEITPAPVGLVQTGGHNYFTNADAIPYGSGYTFSRKNKHSSK